MSLYNLGYSQYNNLEFPLTKDKYDSMCVKKCSAHICYKGIHISMLISIIVLNVSILYIIIDELFNFKYTIRSFKSNIYQDVDNFNDFLQIIPELKEVLNIIIGMCNIEAIQPYCNNKTYVH